MMTPRARASGKSTPSEARPLETASNKAPVPFATPPLHVCHTPFSSDRDRCEGRCFRLLNVPAPLMSATELMGSTAHNLVLVCAVRVALDDSSQKVTNQGSLIKWPHMGPPSNALSFRALTRVWRHEGRPGAIAAQSGMQKIIQVC